MLPQLYKTFQHWSEKGSVYIYSDPHFYDKDCSLMDPNWVLVEDQIKIINNLVHKNDTLILLGDIGDIECIKKLKAGYKVLITGNHDCGVSKYQKTIIKKTFDFIEYENENELISSLIKEYPYSKITGKLNQDAYFPFFEAEIDNNLFDEVYNGPLFISDKILLSHEPIDLPFALNIHGHNHNGKGLLSEDGHKFNVCANTIAYTPINLKNIIETGYLKKIDSIHRVTIDKASKS